MKKLSLIIPCYNEEEIIEISTSEIINSLKNIKESYELIFVDDGSVDNTFEKLKHLSKSNKNIKIISLSRNFGQQAAIRAGLENSSGDYIGFIDADLQDPPYLIPKMLEKIKEGYDVVFGQRLKRKNDSIFKRITSACYYKIFNLLSDLPAPENVSDFKIITRQVANELIKIKEQNQSIRSIISFLGFKQTGIMFERPKRIAGKTKYNIKKMIKLAEDGLFSSSSKLLKMPFYFCFIIFLFTILTSLLFVFGFNINANLLLIIISLYISCILFILGIFGIYLNKIYDNTKNRPLYIIKEKINFD